MATIKTLRALVERLNKVTHAPTDPYGTELIEGEPKPKACIGAYVLEANSPGDGHTRYRIGRIANEAYGICEPFGSRNLTARECEVQLWAILDTLREIEEGNIPHKA